MPIKERFVTALSNISGGLELGIYRNGVDEGLAGLLERVFYVKSVAGGWQSPPKPEDGFWEGTMRRVGKKSYVYPVSQLSFEEFIARYKGGKLATYQQGLATYITYGLDIRKDTFVGAFVKQSERQARGKAPRLIRPFSIVFNLVFGTFVYPLEKCLYSAIDGLYDSPTVTKGLNCLEVAAALAQKWAMFGDPVCLITDMSRFDQHCTPSALRWVQWMCVRSLRKTGADIKLFERLFRATINTRGMVLCDNGVINYSIEGTLNSGLSSTSLCGVTIVCFLLRSYCLSVGVRHQLISAGDDTNIIIERRDLHLMGGLSAWCLRGGFTVKIDGLADVMERVDFCQMRPIFDGNNWLMVRNPRVVTTKDLLTERKFSTVKSLRGHIKAIAQCGIALSGGVPVMQSFYNMLLRSSVGADATPLERNGFYYLSRNMDREIAEVSDVARISFYKAFGINIWRQVELERMYDHMSINTSLGVERSSDSYFSTLLFHAFEEEN